MARCQAYQPHPDGRAEECPRDGDYAALFTPWGSGGQRLYLCAEHVEPRDVFHAVYYVGRGAMSAKVVPIEAARLRRLAKAQ